MPVLSINTSTCLLSLLCSLFTPCFITLVSTAIDVFIAAAGWAGRVFTCHQDQIHGQASKEGRCVVF